MSQLQLKLNLPSEGHLDTGRSAWARRQVGIIRVIGQPDAVAHSTPKAGLVQPGPVDQPELAHGPGVGSVSALPSRRGHLYTALNRRPAPAEEDVAFSVGSSQPRQPQANVLPVPAAGQAEGPFSRISSEAMPIDPFYGLPVNDSAILGFWGSARTSVQGIPRGSCSGCATGLPCTTVPRHPRSCAT